MVDGAALETQRVETPRGFESYLLRQTTRAVNWSNVWSSKPEQRISIILARSKIKSKESKRMMLTVFAGNAK